MSFKIGTSLFYLFILFSLTSFGSKKKIENIHLQYSELIEGYRISFKFSPKVVYYEDNIIGRGTIYFHHLKTNQKFKVYNPMMGFPTRVLPLKLSKNKRTITRLIKRNKSLHYIFKAKTLSKTEFENFGTTKVPFFFYDLNLDGVKELLIPQMNSGQRGVAIFKPYELKDGKLFFPKNSFIKKKPFTELDEMSKINSNKRTIIIHGSNGACQGTDKIYTFDVMNKSTPFVYSYLTKEVAINHSTGKCITKTIKIN